jgi:hypothetical protein
MRTLWLCNVAVAPSRLLPPSREARPSGWKVHRDLHITPRSSDEVAAILLDVGYDC